MEEVQSDCPAMLYFTVPIFINTGANGLNLDQREPLHTQGLALPQSGWLTLLYRGTSLIRNSAPLGHYSMTMPRALWRS